MPQNHERMKAALENLKGVKVESLAQGWGELQMGRDLLGHQPLYCGGRSFDFGFGSHADSRIRISSEKPLRRFCAAAGIGEDRDTRRAGASDPVRFRIEAGGRMLASSPLLRFGEVFDFAVELPEGTHTLDLVGEGPEGTAYAHIVWGAPELEMAGGEVIRCGEAAALFEAGFPVNFQYGDRSAGAFFAAHGLRQETEEKEDAVLHRFISEGGGLRMEVRLTEYRDWPVWEWHTAFENISSERSQRLSGVSVLDLESSFRGRLLRRRGSYHCTEFGERFPDWFRKSYSADEREFEGAETVEFGAVGGRPSVDWLPCFDVTDGAANYRFVIGWAGQWRAAVEKLPSGRFRWRAGMEELDAVLEPGERIELPSMFFQYNGEGGEERAVNLWRRFVTEKVMLPFAGKPPVLPVSFMHWGGMSERRHLERLEDMQHHGFPWEVYWIDAGWFAPESRDEHEPVWYRNVGDWSFDPAGYPEELRNLSKAVHAAGKKLLLWIEPERVCADRRLAKEHPEYLIWGEEEGRDALLDLGEPAAWEWCFQTVAGIIERNGVDWYREDFNFSPLPYWRRKDVPERKGITEIRFVAGLYRFWRRLRETFPHLQIDNCASGGRRLDVELLRYSVPLWYSDMQCGPGFDPEFSLSHIEGMSTYWPRYSCGVQNQEGGDTYNFRASMTAGINIHYFYPNGPLEDGYPHEWLTERLREYGELRDYYSCDFYCLAAPPADRRGMWTIFQYDRPEEGDGIVTLFRGEASGVGEYRLRLRGLVPEKEYEISDLDGLLPPFRMKGEELTGTGFPLRIDEPRTARILRYS